MTGVHSSHASEVFNTGKFKVENNKCYEEWSESEQQDLNLEWHEFSCQEYFKESFAQAKILRAYKNYFFYFRIKVIDGEEFNKITELFFEARHDKNKYYRNLISDFEMAVEVLLNENK